MKSTSHNVLIIDDDEGDRQLIKEALTRLGTTFDLCEAGSGEEGLQKIQTDKANFIVIINTHLPGIDGFETCRRIKQLPMTRTKVIICTGIVDAVDAGKARQMGADDFCVKTSDYGVLMAAVQKMV